MVLAEDSYLVREGVRRLLETDPDIELTSSCVDLEGLLSAVERDRPDVVVTDIRMPPRNTDEGIQARVVGQLGQAVSPYTLRKYGAAWSLLGGQTRLEGWVGNGSI